MRKSLFGLMFLASGAHAQSEDTDNAVSFYTAQPCYPISEFVSTTIYDLREQALFNGTVFTYAEDGTMFEGAGMFFVNFF